MTETEPQDTVAEVAPEELASGEEADSGDEAAPADDPDLTAAPDGASPPREVDYLAPDLFQDIRRIKPEDLISDSGGDEDLAREQVKYINTFADISEHQIVTGRVIGMNDKEILIDIGFKSEGIIDRSEFTPETTPQIGDQLEIFLQHIEDESGKTVLSKEKADFMRRWQELQRVYEEGDTISGRVARRIKGGMIVDLEGVQAFLPGSQIDVRPVKDFDQYIDRELDLRVVKLNESRKNVVVSHKAILEEDLKEQREALFEEMEVGKIIEGRVKNITDFGVFIDLGGIDGLLHITDLSWGRVNHPSEIVAVDDTLTVKIIDFDREKKRVSLGLKQLTPHPWEHVEEKYPVGTKITGRVVSMTNYGAFVVVEPGVEGLVHVSEMSWTRHVKNPSEVYSLGDEVETVVLSVDSRERKISLGAKQLLPDPWDEIEDRYMVGSLQQGTVINLTQFGAFVELEEGIDGLIHVSDLSWTKIVRHPREVVEKGQQVEVRILEVSRANRRIALGLKQVTEDPWPVISKHFETGKIVEGKVIRVLDKGIILQLEMDVEGIVPFNKQTRRQRNLVSEKYKPGEPLSGVVMEVKPEDKKVVLFMEELESGSTPRGDKGKGDSPDQSSGDSQ